MRYARCDQCGKHIDADTNILSHQLAEHVIRKSNYLTSVIQSPNGKTITLTLLKSGEIISLSSEAEADVTLVRIYSQDALLSLLLGVPSSKVEGAQEVDVVADQLTKEDSAQDTSTSTSRATTSEERPPVKGPDGQMGWWAHVNGRVIFIKAKDQQGEAPPSKEPTIDELNKMSTEERVIQAFSSIPHIAAAVASAYISYKLATSPLGKSWAYAITEGRGGVLGLASVKGALIGSTAALAALQSVKAYKHAKKVVTGNWEFTANLHPRRRRRAQDTADSITLETSIALAFATGINSLPKLRAALVAKTPEASAFYEASLQQPEKYQEPVLDISPQCLVETVWCDLTINNVLGAFKLATEDKQSSSIEENVKNGTWLTIDNSPITEYGTLVESIIINSKEVEEA